MEQKIIQAITYTFSFFHAAYHAPWNIFSSENPGSVSGNMGANLPQ